MKTEQTEESVPRVSVLMAVCNGERYLVEALNSVLSQTFADFEFLIIDDGSTDATAQILSSHGDRRLRVHRNETNQGLTRSLNRGLSLARGRYLARMDADDIAHPERLREQVQYMDAHSNVGLLGSCAELIDAEGAPCGHFQVPTNDTEIRWFGLLNNPFIHPSVMLRRDLLVRHVFAYNTRFVTTQDYELWWRLLGVTEGANLSRALIQYRMGAGVAAQRRRLQLRNHDAVAWRAMRHLFPDLPIGRRDARTLRLRFGAKCEEAGDPLHATELYSRMLYRYARGQSADLLKGRYVRRDIGHIVGILRALAPSWTKVVCARRLARLDVELTPFYRQCIGQLAKRVSGVTHLRRLRGR